MTRAPRSSRRFAHVGVAFFLAACGTSSSGAPPVAPEPEGPTPAPGAAPSAAATTPAPPPTSAPDAPPQPTEPTDPPLPFVLPATPRLSLRAAGEESRYHGVTRSRRLRIGTRDWMVGARLCTSAAGTRCADREDPECDCTVLELSWGPHHRYAVLGVEGPIYGVSFETIRAPSPALLVTVGRSEGTHVWNEDALVIEARGDDDLAIVWHGTINRCSDEGCMTQTSVALRDEDRDGDLDLVVEALNESEDGSDRLVYARAPDGSFPPSNLVRTPIAP